MLSLLLMHVCVCVCMCVCVCVCVHTYERCLIIVSLPKLLVKSYFNHFWSVLFSLILLNSRRFIVQVVSSPIACLAYYILLYINNI